MRELNPCSKSALPPSPASEVDSTVTDKQIDEAIMKGVKGDRDNLMKVTEDVVRQLKRLPSEGGPSKMLSPEQIDEAIETAGKRSLEQARKLGMKV